jgi:hypothetical protein
MILNGMPPQKMPETTIFVSTTIFTSYLLYRFCNVFFCEPNFPGIFPTLANKLAKSFNFRLLNRPEEDIFTIGNNSKFVACRYFKIMTDFIRDDDLSLRGKARYFNRTHRTPPVL